MYYPFISWGSLYCNAILCESGEISCVWFGLGIITPQQKEKKPHIKKPLNAFMLFMKEKRAEVIKECTLKESAAINQILGKMVIINY